MVSAVLSQARRSGKFRLMVLPGLLLGLALSLAAGLTAADIERSRRYFEESQGMSNMAQAADSLRLARDYGAGTVEGSRAVLELARLEYAQDRPDAALFLLVKSDNWPRTPEQDPEWLYLRGQCRLLGKGLKGARDDFQLLASSYPAHALAPTARLAAADCDAALREDARAVAVYQDLAFARSPVAAQALWGLGQLQQRAGKAAEAQAAYERLQAEYPASFEASAAAAKIAELKKLKPLPRPKPVAKPKVYFVRVGAYSNLKGAQALVKTLKRNHYKLQVKDLHVAGRELKLVRTGPHAKKSQAEADVKRLKNQDKLDSWIVEE